MNVFEWSAIFIILSVFVISIIIFVSYLKTIVEDCLRQVKEIKKEQELIQKMIKDDIIELLNILKNTENEQRNEPY